MNVASTALANAVATSSPEIFSPERFSGFSSVNAADSRDPPLSLPTRMAFIGNYLPRQCGIQPVSRLPRGSTTMNIGRPIWPAQLSQLLLFRRSCPLCSSVEFVEAESQLLDGLLAVFGLRPVRCKNCRRRYYWFATKDTGNQWNAP
jgi:hypothetical protein